MGDAERIMEMPRTQSYHEPRGPYYIVFAAISPNAANGEKLSMIVSTFGHQLIKQVFVFWIPKFGSFGITR